MMNPLSELMQIAVPLQIERLIAEGCSLENFEKFKAELDDYQQEALDNPQFTEALVTRIKGQSATSFNRTARAVAILSFLPGGVSIFGRDFAAADYIEVTEDKD